MDKSIKTQWLTLLEVTPKCRGALRRGNCYCALGVLCTIYDKTKWTVDKDVDHVFMGNYASLPTEVQRWAGLSDAQVQKVMEISDLSLDSFDEVIKYIKENL